MHEAMASRLPAYRHECTNTSDATGHDDVLDTDLLTYYNTVPRYSQWAVGYAKCLHNCNGTDGLTHSAPRAFMVA